MIKVDRKDSLDEYVEKYLDYLKYEKKLSINTYKSYQDNLIKFKEYFIKNNIRIISINYKEDDIKDFIYHLDVTSKSKAHYLTVLKSYYSFLVNEGIININPCDSIKMPKIEKTLPNYLTIEEIDKLLDIRCDKPIDYRNKAMLEVLYGSGMRISELTNLTLSQVDFNADTIKVMGKGKKERIVPLNDVAKSYLKEYVYNYRPFLLKNNNSEYIFINSFSSRISRQGFFKIIKRICEEKGINKNVSPHTLRHSFATHLLNNGADLRVIQELLGHENIITTEIYSHLQNKKIKDDYSNHPRAK